MPKSLGGRRARLAATALATAALAIGFAVPQPAAASSHREAPLISADPQADNTDLYAFSSPDDANNASADTALNGTVTLVANYVPFQQPAGGPNFYRFGDDVLYQIHIDNKGDARDHIVFSFRFHTHTLNPDTFLYDNLLPQNGVITCSGHTYRNWNRPQTYEIDMTNVDTGVTRTLGDGRNTELTTPPTQVGPVATPDYPSLAACATYTGLGDGSGNNLGISSFAGQRDDPFFADLGRVFDVLDVFGPTHQDYLAGLNVNSIVLRVPKSMLLCSSCGGNPVIGVWATASRKATTVLQTSGIHKTSGPWVQVSRLGNPLVNEVVIPLGQKDHFNASVPANDGQFASDVVNPEFARILNLFDANVPTTSRADLVATFLTGLGGINMPAGVTPSEELRLNLATPVTHPDDINGVSRYGALGEFLGGKAPEGFPNGRRLADDTVDIAVLAVAGVLCEPDVHGALGLAQCRPNDVPAVFFAGDGVNANDTPFSNSFPYEALPWAP